MFCDADDAVSPQLISVVTQALKIYNAPDVLVYHHFTNLPDHEWATYDVDSMTHSDGEKITREELCFLAVNDNSTGGYLWNKVLKRELSRNIWFDETLSVMDDRVWLLTVLNSHEKLSVYYLKHYLYSYIWHDNSGLTRDAERIYTKDGLSWFIECMRKELAIKNLPEKARMQIQGAIYDYAINALYHRPVKMSSKAIHTFHQDLRQHYRDYYFRRNVPLSWKIKTLIKHILILMHIHKPRR